MRIKVKVIRALPFASVGEVLEMESQGGGYMFWDGDESFKIGHFWQPIWGSPIGKGFIEEVKPELWRPKMGSAYWYLDQKELSAPMSIGSDKWEDYAFDSQLFSNHNIFPTKAAAQAMCDKINAMLKEEHERISKYPLIRT